MTALAVSFDGTRVNAADSATDFGHWGGSGPAPAAEAPLAYQNALAINKKTTATSLAGIDYDPGASPIDMTAAANKLLFLKMYVSDSFDLNVAYGANAGIGSALADMYEYNMAGSGANNDERLAYPAQGGYLIAAIDPNISQWRETINGSPDLTNVDWYGVQCAVINGAAKAENLAWDAIDVGTGLTIVSGDGADTPGTFPDFVAWDQDITTNRYGVVVGGGNAVTAIGLLSIGSATATEFLDTESVVTFPDGYHSVGLVGVYVDIQSASSIILIDSLIIGEGRIYGADDTRPDFEVSGTSGSFDSAAQLRNFRNVTYTSVCDIDGADIECELLVQGSANISNTIIRTNALTSIACLQDPVFGTVTDLHDVDFIQSGAGHALEINAAGSYTFTNLTFTGYGADTTDDAALDITASSGTVTITLVGASPTYKTAGATVVFNNDVTMTFSNLRDLTEVRVYDNATGVELDGIEDATAGTVDDRSFGASVAGGTLVDYVIHNKQYEYIRVEGFTWPSLAQTLVINQRFDRNYDNP